jgi:ABC-type phosphate/phosphonate transport system substrate-binding protein
MVMTLSWIKIFWIGLLLCFSFSTNAEFDDQTDPSLRVGFYLKSFPYVSRTDAEVGLKYWAEQTGKQNNFKITLELYEDIKRLRSDFDARKINFVVAAPLIILQHFDRNSFADGFTVAQHKISNTALLVITRKNDHYDDFKTLNGKKLGLIENDLISEIYLDYLSLKNFGKSYKNTAIKVVLQPHKAQLVLDLFFKKVDAIILYETSYQISKELNPQIAENTQIIGNLPNINWGLGLFHKDVPQDFRTTLITLWENLGKKPGDQYLLHMFESDSFVRASIDNLDPIEDFLTEYHTILQNTKKSGIHR